MNYRDDLDDFKLNSHLDNDDWQAGDFKKAKSGTTLATNQLYKKSTELNKRSSYSDNDLSPSEHRVKHPRDDDGRQAVTAKKYNYDLYNNSNYKDNLADNYKDSHKDTFKETYKDSYKDITFKDTYKDTYKDSYKDSQYKDTFKETFKESYKDTHKDTLKDTYKDTHKDTYKDTYKDTFKESQYKDIYKGTYKDPYKENDLVNNKVDSRRYNDLDKSLDKKYSSSASEHSDYRNLEYDDVKKQTNKRASIGLPDGTNQTSKTGELRKLDYRRSSDLRRSIDLGKDDSIDNPIENISKVYRSSIDEKGDLMNKATRYTESYLNQSDTDTGANYRKYSDYDKYSDSSINPPKSKQSNFDKHTSRLEKQYDFGDGILDEIRRLELKEEVRKNEIMTELKNAENVLKHQNNHHFKPNKIAEPLDNQIKNLANLSKTSKDPFSMKELDKLMAKLDQDNKKLAELDLNHQKARTTLASYSNLISKPSSQQAATLLGNLTQLHSSLPTLNNTTSNLMNLSSYANKSILSALDNDLGYSNYTNPANPTLSSLGLTNYTSLPKSTFLDQNNLYARQTLSQPTLAGTSALTSALNDVAAQQKQLQQQIQQQMQQQQQLLNNTQQQRHQSTVPQTQYSTSEVRTAEDIVDTIEIANKGRFRVFIARFSYDPFKQSPNEHPEAELHLSAGDFLLVQGDLDEDGFYFGEHLDGRKGLLPSNFVEKLTGEDLYEFQSNILYGHKPESLLEETGSLQFGMGLNNDLPSSALGSTAGLFPPEFYDALLTDAMSHTNFQHLLAPEDFHRMNDYVDLAESQDINEEDLSDVERAQAIASRDSVAPPKRLILERQLHKSILIGWLHPDCPRGLIDCYHIYVDGVLKASVPSGERTKALVEGVDSSIPHRISIRAVTAQGNVSRDPACTIIIGKIAVNSVEVKTVPPTHYKHLITGLASNTLYRVSVRAKPGKLLSTDSKNPKKMEMLTTYVDFKTLPKSLPEPPVDVQVEAGPQEGTILVTWLPVTLDQFGTSNNCPVTGYSVFSQQRKLAEIDSPTADHALLDITQLESFHKKAVTVRTKSGETLSHDSMPCQIPDDLLKYTAHRKTLRGHTTKHHSRNSMHHSHHLHATQPPIPGQLGMQAQMQQPRSATNQDLYATDAGQAGLVDPMMGMNRMQIPAIEITKETPSDMNQMGIHVGPSPQPPQRHHLRNAVLAGRQHKQQMHQHMQQNKQNFRWFVALYDYDPMTMSPNPDTADEELPFREGDFLKIYGEKDADGFYRGSQANGRHGYVPCNMVSEINYDPETGLPTNTMRQQQFNALSAQDPWSHLQVRRMVALYDYDPLELSPNPDAEMELAFNTGDIIYVYGDMDDDGFFMGEVNGTRGLVPSNFLSEAPPDGRRGRHGASGQYIHPSSARNMRGPMPLSQQQMMNMRQRPTSLDLNQMGQPRFGQPGMQLMIGQQQPGMQPLPGQMGQMQPGQQQGMMGVQIGQMGPQQGQFMQPGQMGQQPMGQMQPGPQPQQPTQQQTHQPTSLISSLFGGGKKDQQTQQQQHMMSQQQPGMQAQAGQMQSVNQQQQGMMGSLTGQQMPGQQSMQQMGMAGTSAYGQPQIGQQGIQGMGQMQGMQQTQLGHAPGMGTQQPLQTGAATSQTHLGTGGQSVMQGMGTATGQLNRNLHQQTGMQTQQTGTGHLAGQHGLGGQTSHPTGMIGQTGATAMQQQRFGSQPGTTGQMQTGQQTTGVHGVYGGQQTSMGSQHGAYGQVHGQAGMSGYGQHQYGQGQQGQQQSTGVMSAALGSMSKLLKF